MENEQNDQPDQEKQKTITPDNVNELCERLNLLFYPTGAVQHSVVPFAFYPREDICGIELRMYSVICLFGIKLTPDQVYSIIEAASNGADGWASIFQLDMMKMENEGTDPRLITPGEYDEYRKTR